MRAGAAEPPLHTHAFDETFYVPHPSSRRRYVRGPLGRQDDARPHPYHAPQARLRRARVTGYDIVPEAVALRSVIGLAGQDAAVDELLTGRENLELVGLWVVSRFVS